MISSKTTDRSGSAANFADTLQSLTESEGEKSLLLQLSKDITSCRTKGDIQQMVADRLGKYFRFNEIMLCLDNEDNLTHTNYIHTITEQTMNHPDFAKERP